MIVRYFRGNESWMKEPALVGRGSKQASTVNKIFISGWLVQLRRLDEL